MIIGQAITETTDIYSLVVALILILLYRGIIKKTEEILWKY